MHFDKENKKFKREYIFFMSKRFSKWQRCGHVLHH
jgi:hypothetical protein